MDTQIRTAVLAFIAATLATAQAFGLNLTQEQVIAAGAEAAALYALIDVLVRWNFRWRKL